MRRSQKMWIQLNNTVNTYQCEYCKTLFTVYNPLKPNGDSLSVDQPAAPVNKIIHCPNSECMEGWETLTPIEIHISPAGQQVGEKELTLEDVQKAYVEAMQGKGIVKL